MEKITDNYYALYIYLDALWRRRYLIITCIIITPFFALLSAELLPKHYKASISIAVSNIATPSLKDVSNSVDITQEFARFQAYLTSPAVLKETVLETKLIPENSSDKYIQETTEALKKNLTITLIGKVVQIDLVQDSPNQLSNILNTLGTILIKQVNSQNTNGTHSTLTALKNELNDQKQILNKAIDELNNYENNHMELLPHYKKIYLDRLRQITSELGESKIQYDSMFAQQKELLTMLLKMNPQIGQIENDIRGNDNKLSYMRLIYTDNYPGIKDLIQRGESLRTERDRLYKQYQNADANMLQTLWNMAIAPTNTKKEASSPTLIAQLEKLRDMQLKIKGLTQQIDDLAKQQKEINNKLQLIDATDNRLSELNQTIKNNQSMYDDLQNRYNLLKISESLSNTDQTKSAQIVAYPQKPITSLARPPVFFFIFGIFSGIFLGFGLAIIFEFMDNTVRHRRDIESIDHIRVICRVEEIPSI